MWNMASLLQHLALLPCLRACGCSCVARAEKVTTWRRCQRLPRWNSTPIPISDDGRTDDSLHAYLESHNVLGSFKPTKVLVRCCFCWPNSISLISSYIRNEIYQRHLLLRLLILGLLGGAFFRCSSFLALGRFGSDA